MNLLRLLMCCLVLSACSTTSQTTTSNNKTPSYTVPSEYDGVRAEYKYFNENAQVQTLKSGIEGDSYVRIIALSLSDTPVSVAVSRTKLKNTFFKNVLENSGNGLMLHKLLTSNPSVELDENIQVSSIKIGNIHESAVKNYLYSIGYSDHDVIVKRQTQIYYKNQRLDHTKYILPTIEQFVTFSNE